MKKAQSIAADPNIRAEYDFSKRGIRGIYVNRVAEGYDIVVLDDEPGQDHSTREEHRAEPAARDIARNDGG